MHFYILQTSTYVKIGISEEPTNRFYQISNHNSILNSKIFTLQEYPIQVLNFIEVSTIHHFQSETEYIINVSFKDVVNYVENILSNVVYHFFFLNPLHTELCCINNLYYDMKPALYYVNSLRKAENKTSWFLADYVKTKETKKFNEIICKYQNLSTSFLTKQGKYGSTYGVPEILFDFICSSSMLAKYNLINWAINCPLEYKEFCNQKTI